MKRYRAVIVLLALAVLPLGGALTGYAQDGLSWGAGVSSAGVHMPFRPEHQSVCRQNPPDFKWPYIDGATRYELQICRDAAMGELVWEAGDIRANYYNFPHTFPVDTYYWRVRYFVGAQASQWSGPRRFRIDPDAYPFPVPPVAALVSMVSPGHPRIWTNSGNLSAFRALSTKGNGLTIYNAAYNVVYQNITSPLPPAPTIPPGLTGEALLTAQRNLRTESDRIVDIMFKTAFVYLVKGNITVRGTAVGDFAKNQLLSIASWDPDGDTGYTASASQSQAHRYIAYRSAMAYDWIYDKLTPPERAAVLEMIRVRTQVMVDELLEDDSPIEKRPFDSHGWSQLGYIGIVATAVMGEVPQAQSWFTRVIPAYINLLPPWSGEDGGWSQGTDYWQYGSLFNKELMDVLLSATGFSLYDKAYARAEGDFPLYMFPKGSTGAFGDASYSEPTGYSVRIYKRLAAVYQNPVMQWAWKQIGNLGGTMLEGYYNDYEAILPEPPVAYDKGKWFQDIDQTAMHSDLADPDRVSFFFKSSPYGSYNHSHPDQNSFVINAFGQRLAIDSGYYDAYGSAHDIGYAKKTYAHNAITYDGGKGQPANDMTAAGDILGFVTHPAFDAVTGDATPAYKGGLGKAVRHVVFMRPDLFIVIDDLEAAPGGQSRFEWWLNAYQSIALHPDKNGASITRGNASLDALVHYPQSMQKNYSDQFAGPDGVAYPAGYSFAGSPVHKRVWFSTDPAEKTAIVSTLHARKSADSTQNVVKTLGDNYVKLLFEDGAEAYIRLEGDGEVDTGTITFNGAAAVVKGESSLLVAGTALTRNGRIMVQSDVPVTAAIGKEEADISCFDDGQVRIYAPNTARILDGQWREIPRVGGQLGVTWAAEGEELALSLERGPHTLRLMRDTRANAENTLIDVDFEALDHGDYFDDVKTEVPAPYNADLSSIKVAPGDGAWQAAADPDDPDNTVLKTVSYEPGSAEVYFNLFGYGQKKLFPGKNTLEYRFMVDYGGAAREHFKKYINLYGFTEEQETICLFSNGGMGYADGTRIKENLYEENWWNTVRIDIENVGTGGVILKTYVNGAYLGERAYPAEKAQKLAGELYKFRVMVITRDKRIKLYIDDIKLSNGSAVTFAPGGVHTDAVELLANADLNPASVTADRFTLTKHSGEAVAVAQARLDEADPRKMILTPAQALAFSTQYMIAAVGLETPGGTPATGNVRVAVSPPGLRILSLDYQKNGQDIGSVEAGDVTVRLWLFNEGGLSQETTVIQSLTRGGRVESVRMAAQTIPKQAAALFENTITVVPAGPASDYRINTYIWSNAQAAAPLLGAVSFGGPR